MNKCNFCLLTALFLIFGVMMSACTATKTNDKVSTNGTTLSSTIIDSPSTTDTTTGSTTTTAITTTELAAITTTITKKLTTTSQTQSTASPTRRPAETIKAKGEITFDYNSDDFTALRQYIQKKFPNEKNLAEFRAKKIEETNKGYDGFRVAFTRWINGCGTDSHYVLYFDTDGALVEIVERSLDYDASKVKAPRVPTEAEIEAAKQAEIEKNTGRVLSLETGSEYPLLDRQRSKLYIGDNVIRWETRV